MQHAFSSTPWSICGMAVETCFFHRCFLCCFCREQTSVVYMLSFFSLPAEETVTWHRCSCSFSNSGERKTFYVGAEKHAWSEEKYAYGLASMAAWGNLCHLCPQVVFSVGISIQSSSVIHHHLERKRSSLAAPMAAFLHALPHAHYREEGKHFCMKWCLRKKKKIYMKKERETYVSHLSLRKEKCLKKKAASSSLTNPLLWALTWERKHHAAGQLWPLSAHWLSLLFSHACI